MGKRWDRTCERIRWNGIDVEIDWEDIDGLVYMMAVTVDRSPLPDTYNGHPVYINRECLAGDLAAAGGPVAYMRGVLDRLAQGNAKWAALVDPTEQMEMF